MTWRFGGPLDVFASTVTFSHGHFRLYTRSVSQTISRLSASSNCGKIIILSTKHILHIVPQCLSFTLACLKSSLWTVCASYEVFTSARFGERVGCFPLLFPYIYSGWFSSLLFVGWYDSSIPIASASLAAVCWNHHFGIQSDEICTSQKGLPTHSDDPMASLIAIKSLGCWIASMILVKTGFGCQRFSVKFIQQADHFIPCKHPVP